MNLKPLGRGVWIDPDLVESVIAFRASEEFGHKRPPHVVVQCRGTTPVWHFETYENALEFAEWIIGKLTP